jgi:hypothetical protein
MSAIGFPGILGGREQRCFADRGSFPAKHAIRLHSELSHSKGGKQEMLKEHFLISMFVTCSCLTSTISSSVAAEKQKYYFLVFSNPVSGKEDTYLKWYEGQHIHDLLRIPGFVAAQFFKLSDTQFDGTQPQRYMMIWEIETDNLPAVFADVNARLKDGRTVFTDAFDPGYNSITMYPITKRVTAEDVQGKSVDEVGGISKSK